MRDEEVAQLCGAGANHHNEDPPVLPHERCDSCPEQTSHGRHPVAGTSSSPLSYICIVLLHDSNAQCSFVWSQMGSNSAEPSSSGFASCMLHCDGRHAAVDGLSVCSMRRAFHCFEMSPQAACSSYGSQNTVCLHDDMSGRQAVNHTPTPSRAVQTRWAVKSSYLTM